MKPKSAISDSIGIAAENPSPPDAFLVWYSLSLSPSSEEMLF